MEKEGGNWVNWGMGNWGELGYGEQGVELSGFQLDDYPINKNGYVPFTGTKGRQKKKHLMAGRQDLQQYGTCVDPIWDPFSTDHVRALVRKEASPTSDSNVSKNSTPLTPQEFELLSDSNPFKQDIAEKYGLAYPGITTKSHSHDLLNKAKSLLDSDDLDRVRYRRKSTNDAEESRPSTLRARKHFRESSARGSVVGLNEFLLKNQQSIEESIYKLCDSNVELNRIKREEFLLRNQKSIEESIQRLESFEQERLLFKSSIEKKDKISRDIINKQSETKGHDITTLPEPNNNIQKLKELKLDDNLISFDDKAISLPSVEKLCENSQVSDDDGRSVALCMTRQEPDEFDSATIVDVIDGNVKQKDSYGVIDLEDHTRKREHVKSFSEAQSFGSKDESPLDFPRLLTRSIDIGDLPRLSGDKCVPKSNSSVIDTNDTQLEKLRRLKEGLQQLYHSSSVEPFAPEYVAAGGMPDISPVVHNIGGGQLTENISPAISAESIDFHFGSSLDSSGDSPKSYRSITSASDFVPCSSEANKVVRIQGSCDSDGQGRSPSVLSSSVKSSSVVTSLAVDSNDAFYIMTLENYNAQGPDSEMAERLATDSPITLDDIESKETYSPSTSPEVKEPVRASGDKFSSSFYAVFSTTVSSLEDIACNSQDRTSGREGSPDPNIETTKHEIMMEGETVDMKWEGGSEDFGALGQDDSTFHLDETSGDDSVFDETRSQHCQDELISFADSIQSSDRADHSPCISKDILFQTKVSLSSGDSSRGSISRESMKVNLSQDSSTLEQTEELPSTTSPFEALQQRKSNDVTATLVPLAECKSIDSMLVNMSNDSLATSGAATKASENLAKRQERVNRGSLSIDLRRRNMKDQTRRRSLPMVMLKNLGKAQPLLWTSQSVDASIDVAQRRPSLPLSDPTTREIKTFKSSQTKLQYEDPFKSCVPSFTSFGKQSTVNEKGVEDTKTISPSNGSNIPSVTLDDSYQANIVEFDPWGANILAGSNTVEVDSRDTLHWSAASWGLVKQFSDDFSLDHVVTTFGPIDEKTSESELTKSENDQQNIPQPGKDKTETLLDSRSDLHVAVSELSEYSCAPAHSAAFSSFVRSKIQKPLRAVLPFSHHIQDTPMDETTDSAAVAESEEKTECMSEVQNVNPLDADKVTVVDSNTELVLPPDIVPNGESSPQHSPLCTDELPGAKADNGSEKPLINELQIKSDENDKVDNVTETKEHKFQLHNVAEKQESGSSSDSDGGDIDALVQEYKQEVVGSDDDDIDVIVQEFKEVQPESDPPKMTDADAEKIRKSAFNKLGKVLNKMQSVTKYMTSKKKDKEGDEKCKSPPLSGRHTRSQSEDEGGEGADGKQSNEDAFELLNKAAEVFKQQTVRKKRAAATGVWRSRTVYTETIEPDTEADGDIVARAAILFKGFKSKKVNQVNNGDIKLEGEQEMTSGLPPGNEPGGSIVSAGNEQVTSSDQTKETEEVIRGECLEERVDEEENNRETLQDEDKTTDSDVTIAERVVSAMIDSGFESVIKFAPEQQEKTEEQVDILDLTDIETGKEEILVVEMDRQVVKQDIIDSGVQPMSSPEFKEKNLNELEDDKKSISPNNKEIDNKPDGGVEEENATAKISDSSDLEQKRKISEDEIVGKSVATDEKSVKVGEFSERSLTVDSELEPESPKVLGVLNEHTCDLILSTGYDDGKLSKKPEAGKTSIKPEAQTTKPARMESAKGKLEELAKEISTVEAAGLKDTNVKSVAGNLQLKPPDLKRLSSESTENQDTCSLTVNCPDSPENGISINGDGGFSLCCGRNIKLNCTAMIKKPERRPSAVVIENKRSAMTEEENMFPMKVSESYKQGLNHGVDMAHSSVLKLPGPVRIVRELKVNEHELNRNFAGSREELLTEAENKQTVSKVATAEGATAHDSFNKQQQTTQQSKENDPPFPDNNSPDEGEIRRKRLEKRRSIIENANKEAINMYDSVLDELVKRQSRKLEGEESKSEQEAGETTKSKRYGRVMSDSDFDANFGQAIEKCEQKLQQIAKSEIETGVVSEGIVSDPTQYVQDLLVTIKPRDYTPPTFNMQQSIDVYDNLLYPDSVQLSQDRSGRYRQHGVERRSGQRDYVIDPRSSFTSVVSDGATDEYVVCRRSQGRSKWVSSTPHLSTVEKQADMVNSRTSSFPYLDRPDTIPRNYRSVVGGSASSFNSYSAGWGNYERIDDINDRKSYDSESSTSGLVIPGAGRESTLSDVSDAYIFGEYSTVKDEIACERVIRPLAGHKPVDTSFRFRHFQTTAEDSPYENIKVITSQPVSSRAVFVRTGVSPHGDLTEGYEHYAIISNPMESKYVQYSDPALPSGVIKVSCASQTSMESLVGLVRDDASDILEGLPVFEYTLGATQSTHSHLADAADCPTATGHRYADDKPDLTKQTQSLDRRKMKHQESHRNTYVTKKATKVTFSRDAVLTDVIDGIKKSEQGPDSSGRGIRGVASSTISSIGGGVKEIAKMFHVPFQCCRSSRKEKSRPKTKVGLDFVVQNFSPQFYVDMNGLKKCHKIVLIVAKSKNWGTTVQGIKTRARVNVLVEEGGWYRGSEIRI
ncbi:hypothetical protein Btru_047658 [Bulinus truncatus]|nr:hypothetical protein Btru_047658 [Bulinus truncatus]